MKFVILVLSFIFCCHRVSSQVLVLPGDYPDPSVVQIGDTYWATATTSNWAPAFPILESKDLLTWQPKTFVFNALPAWADFYFWAPEISYDNGKVYVYYTAHKRDGNLCIGVASADKPEGPYQDHGPLICQEAGSIDAFAIRDEQGKLYLVWKEDGNSVNKPTPIWIMEMTEDRRQLVGEKKELFRNDVPWEGSLVEGVAIIRKGEYFYALYSAAACCGRACTYGVGVARAKNIMGPWEKYEKNPILSSNKKWKCPGHGTIVEKDGTYYLLHHAYYAEDDVYTGRQGVLSEVAFTPNGWIRFVSNNNPAHALPSAIVDEFNGNTLSPHWQWSVFQQVQYALDSGVLSLGALPENSGAFLGQKIYSNHYTAEVAMLNGRDSLADAGLALIGDEKNFVRAVRTKNKIVISSREGDKETIYSEQQIKPADQLFLRMTVSEGRNITFTYSLDGRRFKALNKKPVDGFFLPPWDRAVRVALVATGPTWQHARFDHFRLRNHTDR